MPQEVATSVEEPRAIERLRVVVQAVAAFMETPFTPTTLTSLFQQTVPEAGQQPQPARRASMM
eukprot:2787627-Lingulodinium_polyedra.AAC.1